jgi:hypothetical protein
MKRLARIGAYILGILTINAVMAEAQLPPGQVGSTGGVVEVVDSSGSVIATPGQPLLESEKIRTGNASFVDLIIGINDEALVTEQTQIEVRRLGASPLLWLESGKVKVNSRAADIQIQTKFGLFSAAEWPLEAEFTNIGGTVNIVVTEGRIRTQNLDSASVTFGAPGNKGFRSYTAGPVNPRMDVPPPPANLFVQSCIPSGTNTGVPTNSPPQTPTGKVVPAKPRN